MNAYGTAKTEFDALEPSVDIKDNGLEAVPVLSPQMLGLERAIAAFLLFKYMHVKIPYGPDNCTTYADFLATDDLFTGFLISMARWIKAIAWCASRGCRVTHENIVSEGRCKYNVLRTIADIESEARKAAHIRRTTSDSYRHMSILTPAAFIVWFGKLYAEIVKFSEYSRESEEMQRTINNINFMPLGIESEMDDDFNSLSAWFDIFKTLPNEVDDKKIGVNLIVCERSRVVTTKEKPSRLTIASTLPSMIHKDIFVPFKIGLKDGSVKIPQGTDVLIIIATTDKKNMWWIASKNIKRGQGFEFISKNVPLDFAQRSSVFASTVV